MAEGLENTAGRVDNAVPLLRHTGESWVVYATL